MRWMCLIPAALSALAVAGSSWSFPKDGGGSKPCTECHSLSVEEASALLKPFVEKVIAVQAGEVKGLWIVDVESRGKKGPVYVDFSKKHLISGNVIKIETRENLTQARLMELNKIDVSKIPLDDAIVIGKAGAKHRIIVFDDPECPYCQKIQAEMNKVTSQRQDVAFLIKMFPLAIHPKAYEKAKAIVCEKSAQMLEDSLAGKEIPPPKCETKQVDENMALAQKLGITGTPTLVFPDGKVVPGYLPAEKILEMLGGSQAKPGQR